MKRRIRAVSSDVSGTLRNDLIKVFKTANKTLKHFGVHPIHLRTFRKELEIPVDGFYEKMGIHQPVSEVLEVFTKFYESSNIPARLFPDVNETLRMLHEKQKKLAIISTHPQRYLDKDVEPIAHYFSLIKGDVLDKRAAMKEFVESCNVEPTEAMHVGDMEYEIAQAKELGIYTVAVASPRSYRTLSTLIKANPDLIVPDLRFLRDHWNFYFD